MTQYQELAIIIIISYWVGLFSGIVIHTYLLPTWSDEDED